MSINRVIISGNLTRDPELRSTQSGMDVMSFGVAVNDRRRNPQTNEWEDYPNFIDCTMFGARAESLSRYLGKGTKVAIEGKLRWSQWERDGQKRSKLEVIVDELEFMSSRNGGGAQSYGGDFGGNQGYAPAAPAYSAPAPMPAPAPAPAPMPAAPVIDASSSVYDDDIPFSAERKRLIWPITLSSLVVSIASSARTTWSISITKILKCCASTLPIVARSSPVA